jgi:hypothetical protein
MLSSRSKSGGYRRGILTKGLVLRQKKFLMLANEKKRRGMEDDDLDFLFTEGLSVDEKKVKPKITVDQNSACTFVYIICMPLSTYHARSL